MASDLSFLTDVMIELDSATYTTEEGLPTEVCASIVGDVTLAPGARVDFTLELTPLTAGSKNYRSGGIHLVDGFKLTAVDMFKFAV